MPKQKYPVFEHATSMYQNKQTCFLLLTPNHLCPDNRPLRRALLWHRWLGVHRALLWHRWLGKTPLVHVGLLIAHMHSYITSLSLSLSLPLSLSLSPSRLLQETCHPYWPMSIDSDSTAQYGKLLVTLKSEKEDNDKEFIIRKFEITEEKV